MLCLIDTGEGSFTNDSFINAPIRCTISDSENTIEEPVDNHHVIIIGLSVGAGALILVITLVAIVIVVYVARKRREKM